MNDITERINDNANEAKRIEDLAFKAKRGSAEAIIKLFNFFKDRCRGYVYNTWKKCNNGVCDIDDIHQELNLAVIKALNNYVINEEKPRFLYYATKCIKFTLFTLTSMSYGYKYPVSNAKSGKLNHIKFVVVFDNENNELFTDDDCINEVENELLKAEIKDFAWVLLGKLTEEKKQDMMKMRFGILPYTKCHTYREIGEKYNVGENSARKMILSIQNSVAISFKNENGEIIELLKSVS